MIPKTGKPEKNSHNTSNAVDPANAVEDETDLSNESTSTSADAADNNLLGDTKDEKNRG